GFAKRRYNEHMMSVFINSVGSVSPQNTLGQSFFLDEIVEYESSTLAVIPPNYKEFIPPAAARRMAKGIKMSTVSAKTALAEAQVQESDIDAIIVGTGLGCIGDSERFVKDIIDNDEQYLTPTRFIQSSHNTVAGQIALGMGCKGHNFTYVHGAISFESALLDAQMQLQENEAQQVLVGGVDELVSHHEDTHRLVGLIKQEAVRTRELLQAKSPGAVFSEGSNFFVLSNEKKESVYAELGGIGIYNTITQRALEGRISDFLSEYGLTPSQVDVVLLGNNGDRDFDGYYHTLSEGVFKNTAQVYYKHLSGEFDTASAFGFWLGNKILKHQRIPRSVRLNTISSKKLETVLLYNQYRAENHGLVLLKKC
ncbi:MAG: beta-ketoacyl synthase N-terminal-like domain-containing protein, partial [Bacteroidota bacterium]